MLIEDLANLGLSNTAIIQELKLLNHKFTRHDFQLLDSFKDNKTLNEFSDLMHTRCIIYYGRIRIPRWTPNKILIYIRNNKNLDLDYEKYTIDYVNNQFSKWDYLNTTIPLSKFTFSEFNNSNIKLAISLGYGIQEIKGIFQIISPICKIINEINKDGTKINTYLSNLSERFTRIRHYIFYLKREGYIAKRTRDLLCEQGHNCLTYTDDLIEIHYQWNTPNPHVDKVEDFRHWQRSRQDINLLNQNDSLEITETNQLISSTSHLLEEKRPINKENEILIDNSLQGPLFENDSLDMESYFSKNDYEIKEQNNEIDLLERDTNKNTIIEEHSSDNGSGTEDIDETSDKLENTDMNIEELPLDETINALENENNIIDKHSSDEGSENKDMNETNDKLEDMPLSKAFLNELSWK